MKSKLIPTLDAISFDCFAEEHGINLVILDIEGNVVKKSICEEARIQLNTTNLDKGTYYWKAQFENIEIATGKFIVDNQY